MVQSHKAANSASDLPTLESVSWTFNRVSQRNQSLAEGAREARLDDGCAERRPFANLNAAAAAAVVEPRC